MPEAREDCLSVIRLFSIWCFSQSYQKSQELLTQLAPNPEDFHLGLWSFHCFAIRYESLPQKRINMFWNVVIFWECKDLKEIQSHWVLLRSYGCVQEWLQTLFLISSELCLRRQSLALFAEFCIFHLLSEVDVIKTRTWQIMCFSTKNIINFYCYSASSPFMENISLVLFFLNCLGNKL